jgi:quinohemoprotein ethanol dehydrogenase
MRAVFIALALAAVAACSKAPDGGAPSGGITAERIINANAEPGNWLTYGRTYDEQRYSPLDQVNTGNVQKLGLAFAHEFDTARGQSATPLVIDGILYTTTAWSKAYALDARTGKLLWEFDPKVPGETAFKACCDVVNRGMAAWGDKLYLGTLDGRLIALDRATGKSLWSVVTVDQSKPYTITMAPRVVKGKVLIGNGGGEYGVRGYLTAYDANDGKQVWRWYSVPGNPKDGFEQPELAKAAQTWSGEWWANGGGGTIWDSLAYDPELDLLYVGVGNGSPWNHRKRSEGKGDNLFLASIVALRPDSGSYVWHYQTTPGETWDFTATQHLMLADLTINGQLRKVLMQAPKNGFFYVLDRATGELLSAENIVPLTWATGVDMKTGRPIEVEGARYEKKPFLMLPSALGAHNWHPMAFSAQSGLVYIPAQEVPFLYVNDPGYQRRAGAWNTGINAAVAGLPDDKAQRAAIRPMLKGHLAAWDPVAQKEVWRVQHSTYWNGGVLATAGGLVFQGTADGRLVAYDAKTGKNLWSQDIGQGITAPPITFLVDGVQHVAVMAGFGGAAPISGGFAFEAPAKKEPQFGRLLVFKIDGKAALPKPELAARELPDLTQVAFNAALAPRGKEIYHMNCSVCHGGDVIGAVLPDLRYAATVHDQATFNEIVLDGALKDRGMVAFKQWVSPQDSEALRAYILTETQRMIDFSKGS